MASRSKDHRVLRAYTNYRMAIRSRDDSRVVTHGAAERKRRIEAARMARATWLFAKAFDKDRFLFSGWTLTTGGRWTEEDVKKHKLRTANG